MNSKKIILVIGATGAQGLAVIDKLLGPCEDGTPSPYAIRGLTRDPSSRRARALAAKGVELVQGRFDDFKAVAYALKGVYGAWINIDGFSVGEMKEDFLGMRIFELAEQAGVKHYVWSSLDYASKLGHWDPQYKCQHYDAKGRIADWMKAQPSLVGDKTMSWSIVTSGPYMDMLFNMMFGPWKKREDGTVVFVTPIGKGHVPMIALSDLGWWARYTFDHRAETSGVDLKVASDWVGYDYIKSTFEKVTGQKAEVIHLPLDKYFDLYENADRPVSNEEKVGEGSITWRQNFSGWYSLWRDDIVKRDVEWIRKVHPTGHTLESWMREQNYGEELWQKMSLLKNNEDGKVTKPNKARVDAL
ncbi:NAD(P)-binding protein [Laetiporus sulphureus 93-53]|uniref:NAD(P)-binding protein n=1 Tax=Laetiporus sulphureus 93-53 TaxID=1314785 RepID=A0A165C5Z5_9APHY|nr:NAD(P)-binding protein [Laetiporus sulphureus 93-53]KZT02264.1 NAD(P)-binding protein [Laetiporus sulphureus 93-53]